MLYKGLLEDIGVSGGQTEPGWRTGFYKGLWYSGTSAKLKEYPLLPDIFSSYEGNESSSFGVCDHPNELCQHSRYFLNLFSDLEPKIFIVNFILVLKSEQESEYGWRWEKWGPYFGKHKPQAQYLYDEPEIEKVYCFSISEVVLK